MQHPLPVALEAPAVTGFWDLGLVRIQAQLCNSLSLAVTQTQAIHILRGWGGSSVAAQLLCMQKAMDPIASLCRKDWERPCLESWEATISQVDTELHRPKA